MNFSQLIQEGRHITLNVSPIDLKEFAEEIIRQTEERLAEAKKKASAEKYLTAKEAAKVLGVSAPTLWRWNNDGYLRHVKRGTKVYYKSSDVEAIMRGGGHE